MEKSQGQTFADAKCYNMMRGGQKWMFESNICLKFHTIHVLLSFNGPLFAHMTEKRNEFCRSPRAGRINTEKVEDELILLRVRFCVLRVMMMNEWRALICIKEWQQKR